MKVRTVLVLALVAMTALANASQGKPGSCVDPAVKITLATWPGLTTAYGVFGDGVVKDASGNTVYADDSKVYARFQVCNASDDFVLNNMGNSGRVFWWNWGHMVASCTGSGCGTPPSWTSTPQKAGSFFNINRLYEVPVNSSADLWMSGSFDVGNTQYGHRLRNPWSLDYAEAQNPYLNIINVPYPTALVHVTHPDCNTWLVTAIPGPSCDPLTCTSPGPPAFSFPVGTMLAPASSKGNSTLVNVGQYELGFQIKVELQTPVSSCH